MEHAPYEEERDESSGLTYLVPSLHTCQGSLPDQHAWYTQLDQIPKANFSLLKAGGACSIYHWYNHLAALFVPSIGLEVL